MGESEKEPVEVRLVTKSGGIAWVDLVTVPLEDVEGSNKVLVIARDMTRRKHDEEMLRSSEERLKHSVEKLQVSQTELSTPVVQIWDRILALPLIGVIDSIRAQNVMEVLLTKIVETQSELVILDVTGVASMDTQVTNNLLRTVKSSNLLGAECIITGIKPEVAQAMIHLGLDIRMLVTQRDMQAGLKWALSRMGYEIKNGTPNMVEEEFLTQSYICEGLRAIRDGNGELARANLMTALGMARKNSFLELEMEARARLLEALRLLDDSIEEARQREKAVKRVKELARGMGSAKIRKLFLESSPRKEILAER